MVLLVALKAEKDTHMLPYNNSSKEKSSKRGLIFQQTTKPPTGFIEQEYYLKGSAFISDDYRLGI